MFANYELSIIMWWLRRICPFSPDYKSEPYWWMASPRPRFPAGPDAGGCDVAIIGSGYTGLAAALELARGGTSSVVVSGRGRRGLGLLLRNGGQVSSSIEALPFDNWRPVTARYGVGRYPARGTERAGMDQGAPSPRNIDSVSDG